jgi:hypothetical protein
MSPGNKSRHDHVRADRIIQRGAGVSDSDHAESRILQKCFVHVAILLTRLHEQDGASCH